MPSTTIGGCRLSGLACAKVFPGAGVPYIVKFDKSPGAGIDSFRSGKAGADGPDVFFLMVQINDAAGNAGSQFGSLGPFRDVGPNPYNIAVL